MAKDNIEIEVKTRLSKKGFNRIRKYLQKTAKFVKTSHHIDTYYSPVGKIFLKPKYPYEWLSIRERDGKVALNYKHWYPEGAKNTTHCDEYQTLIEDKVQLKKMLSVLKFEKLVSVEKVRLVFKKGDLEVALDNVKSLGFFIEIESEGNLGGFDKTRKRILDFARILQVNVESIIPGGYAAEMMRKKGLLK